LRAVDFKAADAQPAPAFGVAPSEGTAAVPVPAVGSSAQATSAPVTIAAPSVGDSADECTDGGDDGSGRDEDVGGRMATPMHTD